MIQPIVNELEALKAKVDEAIRHAKSGVTTLNEDQQSVLRGMAEAIDKEAMRVRDRVDSILSGVEARVERVVDEVKTGLARVENFAGEVVQKAEAAIAGTSAEPTAADLDAHAAEQQAAADTQQ